MTHRQPLALLIPALWLAVALTLAWQAAPAVADDEAEPSDAATATNDSADENATASEDAEDTDADAERKDRADWRAKWRKQRAEEKEGHPRPGPPQWSDRPGSRDHPRHHDKDRDRPDPEARRKAALAVLKDINPHMAERLAEARERNPERAEAFLDRLRGRLDHLVDLRREDREMYDLRVKDHQAGMRTMMLMRQIREARHDGEEKTVKRLSDQLRDHLEEHFEVRQEIRERELERLEARIQRLRTELKEHRERKGALIDKIVERATAERGSGDREHPHRGRNNDEPDGEESRDASEESE